MRGDREHALAAGCDDYDVKPIEFRRLLGEVLIGLFLDFWARTDGWPQSSSWVEAVHTLDVA